MARQVRLRIDAMAGQAPHAGLLRQAQDKLTWAVHRKITAPIKGGIMKILRNVGSLAFVLGLFTAVFAGMPWYMIVADDPVVPWWLRIAVFCLLGGILVVLLTVALEQWKNKTSGDGLPLTESDPRVLLLNSAEIPAREITEI